MAYTPGRPFLITIDRTNQEPFKAVTKATCQFQPAVLGKDPLAMVPWIWLPDKTRLSPDRKRVTLFVPPGPQAEVPGKPLPPLPCKTIPPVPGKNLPATATGTAQLIQLKTAYSQQDSQSGPGTIIVVIDDDGQPDQGTDPIDVDPIDVDPGDTHKTRTGPQGSTTLHRPITRHSDAPVTVLSETLGRAAARTATFAAEHDRQPSRVRIARQRDLDGDRQRHRKQHPHRPQHPSPENQRQEYHQSRDAQILARPSRLQQVAGHKLDHQKRPQHQRASLQPLVKVSHQKRGHRRQKHADVGDIVRDKRRPESPTRAGTSRPLPSTPAQLCCR